MWHSPESNFTASAQATILYEFEKHAFRIIVTSHLKNIHLVPKKLFFPQVIFLVSKVNLSYDLFIYLFIF